MLLSKSGPSTYIDKLWLAIKPTQKGHSSLDQLRLLRSQHKMARLLLVAALCLASVKAAVIPVEEIVDNLQVWFSLAFNTLTFVYFCNNSFPPRAS